MPILTWIQNMHSGDNRYSHKIFILQHGLMYQNRIYHMYDHTHATIQAWS